MAELAPGSVVAGCRIEAVIGRGGMGLVYRATQLSLERPVALKAIAPELAGDPTFRERFKRESRIAASIEHPNVIPVYDSGEAESVLYLIMRYVDGTDLRALIAREGGGLEPARAARLVAQVASGLAAAHRRGLVHRDVKPANVLVAADDGRDHAYVTDFGIARHVAATSGLTRTGAVVGTLDYLAPERMQGEGGDDAGADVYALGCVLYETLTGSVPYPRDNEVAKMYAHLNAPVPVVRELAPDVPRDFDEIVRCAMAKRPDDRFASAGDLADALTDAAPPPRPVTPLPPSRPAAPAPPSDPSVGLTEEAMLEAEMGPEPPAGLTEEAMLEVETGPELPLAERAETTTAPVAPHPDEPTTAAAPATVESPAGAAGSTTLSATNAEKAVGEAATAAAPRSPRRRRVGLLAVGAALVAALAVAAVLLLGSGGSEDEGPIEQVGDPIGLGGAPDGVGVGASEIWVADRSQNRLLGVNRDDPERSPAIYEVGKDPDSVAVGLGGVWVTNTGTNSVSWLDLGSDEVREPIAVGERPEGILVAHGAVWVANSGDGTVTRIDRDRSTETIDVGNARSRPIQLAATPKRVWVTVYGDRGIRSIDPDTLDVGSLKVLEEKRPRGIAYASARGGQLWVSSPPHNVLVIADATTGKQVGELQVAQNPREVRYDRGTIWVTSAGQPAVTAIDARRHTKIGEVAAPENPYGLAVGAGSAWVASLDRGLLTRFRLR